MPLIGRNLECTALDQVLATARGGMSSAVVLYGEPGIGKSELVRYLTGAATDFHVLRLTGVEAERTFAYAGLQRLLSPVAATIDQLPDRLRSALSVATAADDGTPGGVNLVGLATLTLLAGVAADGPLLVAVDDTQWLDGESVAVIGFVARRLHAEGIAMVLTSRGDEPPTGPLAGLDVVPVPGLATDDAHRLLAEVTTGPIDQLVADGIVAATGGNPLAVTELGGILTADQLSGGSALPEPLPIGARLEAHYLSQTHELPPDTRRWLLVAQPSRPATSDTSPQPPPTSGSAPQSPHRQRKPA